MRNDRGFTIIEVLMALALFALAAVVMGAAYVNVLNAYAVAGRSTQGEEDVRFAREQLMLETDVKKAEEGGEFTSADGRNVRWKAKIQPTQMPDLFDVTFTCESNEPGTTKPLDTTQTFRLLRPTWSDAAERDKLRQEARKRIEELNAKNAKT